MWWMWTIALLFFAAMFSLAKWQMRDAIARTVARLYLGWWALCVGVSLLDPHGMFPVAPFTYLLLLLNVGMFTAGFIAAGHGRESSTDEASYRSLARSFQEHVVKSRPVLLVLAGLSLYLLYYYLRYQEALRDLGDSDARMIRFTLDGIFSRPIERMVYNYIAEALAIVLVCILAYSLILGSIWNWVFLWCLVDLFLFARIGVGRTVIVQGLIFIALLAALRNAIQPASEEGGRKNLLVYVGVPAVTMSLFMVYLTFVRMFGIETSFELAQSAELLGLAATALLDQVQSYAVGSFRALDYALSHPSIFGYHFGRLTFGAVDEMIGYPLRLAGLNYPVVNEQIGEITQDFIHIGSVEFNALFTCVFRFYYDFGIVGVVVFSFLFGALVRGAVLWFQASPTAATISILLFLFGASILSTQTWHLASPSSLIFLGGAFLFQRATAEP